MDMREAAERQRCHDTYQAGVAQRLKEIGDYQRERSAQDGLENAVRWWVDVGSRQKPDVLGIAFGDDLDTFATELTAWIRSRRR